jgi:hypothetical protein
MKQFEIFKAGKHTSVNGTVVAFSQADLAGAVAAYDTALHEAPMVVGHPSMDHPAYGWISKLTVQGDRLVATPSQVDAQFAELVSSGRFKNRSASFYPPDHPSNPKPGHWYLKHVGFLGATAPAVKGLRPVAFGEIEGELEFADYSGLSVSRLFTNLREFLIGQFGQDKADAVLPSDAIDDLKYQAAQPGDGDGDADDDSGSTSYTENIMTNPTAAQIAQREAALAEKEKQLEAQKTAFAEQQRSTRSSQIAAFAERIVTAGKFPSGEKAGLVAFMEALPAGEAVIEFAEPGGKTAKVAPGDYLMGLLDRLPNLVDFGEVAGSADTVNFAEDTRSISLLAEKHIAEQRSLGRDVSSAEAVQHVLGARR